MNLVQFLCTLVSEECNELGQIASKITRFGIHEIKPDQNFTNAERLNQEFIDVRVAIEMLQYHSGLITTSQYSPHECEARKEKLERIREYANYSQRCGAITEFTLTQLESLIDDLGAL